jgi:excinuclease UvrABC nuclease subunit
MASLYFFSTIEEMVIDASDAVESPRGVYFLMNEGRVVYAGQAQDVHSRILAHRRQGEKQFDSARWIRCGDDSELTDIENALIRALSPPLNIMGLGDAPSVSELSIIDRLCDAPRATAIRLYEREDYEPREDL